MIQEIRKLPKLPNVMKQKYSLFLYIQSKGKIFKAGGYIKLLQSVDCKSQVLTIYKEPNLLNLEKNYCILSAEKSASKSLTTFFKTSLKNMFIAFI